MENPKTAEQINLAQIGKIEIPHAPQVVTDTPLAPRIQPAPTEEAATVKNLFARWNVASNHKGHKGLKADLEKEILADEKIPSHWKSALLAEIQLHDCKAMEVHCHADNGHGGFVLSVHLKPLF